MPARLTMPAFSASLSWQELSFTQALSKTQAQFAAVVYKPVGSSSCAWYAIGSATAVALESIPQ